MAVECLRCPPGYDCADTNIRSDTKFVLLYEKICKWLYRKNNEINISVQILTVNLNLDIDNYLNISNLKSFFRSTSLVVAIQI